MKIEVCLEGVDSAIEAQKGGADRIELCSDLFEGGLTPSYGVFKAVKQNLSIPVSTMIRVRGGDFCYSQKEFLAMKYDAQLYKENGTDSLVFGMLREDGEIDVCRTKELLKIADGVDVTFHRAFDVSRDLFKSLEILIDLGVKRILTSGGEPTVMDGFLTLRKLVEKADGRIIIMPGCGINERNFNFLNEQIQASEYHVYAVKKEASLMNYKVDHIYMGGMLRQDEYSTLITDSKSISTYRK